MAVLQGTTPALLISLSLSLSLSLSKVLSHLEGRNTGCIFTRYYNCYGYHASRSLLRDSSTRWKNYRNRINNYIVLLRNDRPIMVVVVVAVILSREYRMRERHRGWKSGNCKRMLICSIFFCWGSQGFMPLRRKIRFRTIRQAVSAFELMPQKKRRRKKRESG